MEPQVINSVKIKWPQNDDGVVQLQCSCGWAEIIDFQKRKKNHYVVGYEVGKTVARHQMEHMLDHANSSSAESC